MKNIALILTMLLIVTACSSGSSEAPQAATVSSTFAGTYTSNTNSETGSVTFDLIEDASQGITGNVFFTPNDDETCFPSVTTVTGTTTGFNITLTSAQFDQTTSSGGTVIASGMFTFQFSINNNGANLTGTYVISGDACRGEDDNRGGSINVDRS